MKDEVLEEIWRVKDAMAAKHNYDLDAIFQELRGNEKPQSITQSL